MCLDNELFFNKLINISQPAKYFNMKAEFKLLHKINSQIK